VLARLKQRADSTPAGKWIVAAGTICPFVAEKRLPTINELDSVSQGHPIAVFNDVHQNVCNMLGATRMKFSTSEIGISIDWLRSASVNTLRTFVLTSGD
jgi:predicted amidohydrolase YtcJ